jgi:anti-sigma B factor antagonist
MTDINITIEDLPVSEAGKVVKQISFKGQLDETNVDEKAKLIYSLIEQNPKNLNLLLDLENLEYMNSKSIGYLTDWFSKVTEGSGKVVIAKARPNILDILEVVGLTQLINCFPTTDEAKLALLDKTAKA